MVKPVQTKPQSIKPSFLRLPQVLQLIPIGRSTWWRWVAEGKAPKGIKLGEKTTAWRSDQIDQLIEDLSKEG